MTSNSTHEISAVIRTWLVVCQQMLCSLSIQSRLVYTGTWCIVNQDGHWTNLSSEPTSYYWLASWPCPAPTSSFQNHAQEQLGGQLPSITSCKKSSTDGTPPSIPQHLLYTSFDWQHESNSFKITLGKRPRSRLTQCFYFKTSELKKLCTKLIIKLIVISDIKPRGRHMGQREANAIWVRVSEAHCGYIGTAGFGPSGWSLLLLLRL